MGSPPEGGAHLEAAAPLAQLVVHRPHQIRWDFSGDVFGAHHNHVTPLLQGAEPIRPELHQLGLAPWPQALPFQVGGAPVPIPQGGLGGVAVAALGEAAAQGGRGGATIPVTQASGVQHLFDVLGGDAVDTADLRGSQPLRG